MTPGGVLFLLLLIALPLTAAGLSLVRLWHNGVAKRYAAESGLAVVLFAILMTVSLDVPAEGRTALRAVTFFAYLWPMYAWVRVVRATRLRWYDSALAFVLLGLIAIPVFGASHFEARKCEGIFSGLETCRGVG
ncbi:hypothetical protein [uncultured Shimia sp.]|uniref:hypothetical protein n=1 Tax=uncultured Shimia sp. TaxID=573152 RepID=UPI00261848FD|nr:hypothetical protein [uncultured Shimia sp.]